MIKIMNIKTVVTIAIIFSIIAVAFFLLQKNISPTPIASQEIAATASTINDCNLGVVTRSLSEDKCQEAQAKIAEDRKDDTAAVDAQINDLQSKINPLNSEIATTNADISGILNAAGGVIPTDWTSSQNSDQQTSDAQLAKVQALENLASFDTNKLNILKNTLTQYTDQLNWYQNYEANISNGAGNGACSGHQGVDPAAGRTSIGQVICNDGWQDSSVYYYNVDKDIDYFLTTL